jgi:hypothetical protein
VAVEFPGGNRKFPARLTNVSRATERRSSGQRLANALTVMRLPLLLLTSLLGVGCDFTNAPPPSARLTGRLDRASFPLGAPTHLEAIADDGTTLRAELADTGTFELPLTLRQTWALRFSTDGGPSFPLALARPGHFDRGVIVQGRAEARLGVVWLPPPETPEVTRLVESQAARCLDGRLEDQTPCAVIESLVSCADGPPRPLEDPTSLLLGVGSLRELPGAGDGVRYVVASWVPPPILWECPAPTLP